jgi:hypothetical protein
MVNLSLSNLVAIIQLLVSITVGLATIFVYFRITALANENNDELNNRNNKNQLFYKINSDLDRIVDFTIQYPYFDDTNYKTKYLNDLTSLVSEERERACRYNAFAIMNYNFVEDLFNYYGGDEDEMEDYCDFKELITDHKIYWENLDEQEKEGYHKIKSLIEKVIFEFEKNMLKKQNGKE